MPGAWSFVRSAADTFDRWTDPDGPPTAADIDIDPPSRKRPLTDWERLNANADFLDRETKRYRSELPSNMKGPSRLRRFTSRARSFRRSRAGRFKRSTGPMVTRVGTGLRRYGYGRRRRMPYRRRKIMRRKRIFTKRVKKVMGSQMETKYQRLDSTDLTDPRVCVQMGMRNGEGYNVRVIAKPGTGDVLFPTIGGTTARTVIGEEYYSMGIRVNIRVTRALSDSNNAGNYVVGYMVYSIKKDNDVPEQTTKGNFTFNPQNGKANNWQLAAGAQNNTRARNEPLALFHRYTTLGILGITDMRAAGYQPSDPQTDPPTYTGWPIGVNPWTDGALHPRVNVLQKGIIMHPVGGITQGNNARLSSAYKSLWIKTGKKINDATYSSANTGRAMLRDTYLAIWCYNPNLKLSETTDSPRLTVEYTHYFKDP